jgi:hypothetical protein
MEKITKSLTRIWLVLLMVAITSEGMSFCGFYVAKADAKLFNNKSEVILVRDGNSTTITMSNDFKGDVRDFAMVVPVPVVLRENDIKVVNRQIFDALDAYSAPRLVEYYDSNPCQPVYDMVEITASRMTKSMDFAPSMESMVENESYSVTIEAQYEVGEYDILILSAKESDGLKRWLIDNGYKIPAQAEEVLEPYIKSKMKFFVAKVNIDKMPNSEFLSPLQINFESDRFMLPLRLGMANSSGTQDMIVYAFTKNGRVESTNYRTIKPPTDRNIPLFVKNKFGEFYKDVFKKQYEREGRNGVFLEYAWDVSPQQAGVKCDPCVGPPPIYQEFAQAGVTWATNVNANTQVFFTRLHVRYSRDKFPQDLFFQETPNRERFQCRYILTHPAKGDLTCDAGQTYLQDLEMKRKREVDELTALTGWDGKYSQNYVNEFSNQLKREDAIPITNPWNNRGGPGTNLPIGLLLATVAVGMFISYQVFKAKAVRLA